MIITIFDTETDGLPKNYKANPSEVNNWPRVIQLAWEVYDSEKESVIVSEKMLIKPDGWTIPKEKFWIDNGFTTETNLEKGVKIDEALNLFLLDISRTDIMVAHNMNFDYNILAAEMIRAKKRSDNKPARFCTMQASTDVCRIPHSNGKGFKWPKLEELHKYLFGKNFEGAHDAGNDVSACRICFLELLKRGHINLPV